MASSHEPTDGPPGWERLFRSARFFAQIQERAADRISGPRLIGSAGIAIQYVLSKEQELGQHYQIADSWDWSWVVELRGGQRPESVGGSSYDYYYRYGRVYHGVPPEDPTIVLRLSDDCFCDLREGDATLEELLADGKATLDGDASLAEKEAALWNDTGPDVSGAVAGTLNRNVIPVGLGRFTDGPLPPQPPHERYTERVSSVLGCNPNSFALNGTNCYLVGTGAKRVLIDASESGNVGKQFVAALQGCMREWGVEGLSDILLTHAHHDHIGGVELLLETFGSDIRVCKFPFGKSSDAVSICRAAVSRS